MIAAMTGLGSDALHALSGPDHLLSLVPLSVGRGTGAWRVGLLWGLGHAAGTLAAAGVLLSLVSAIRLELVGVWAERVAGGALAGMGALNLLALLRSRAPPIAVSAAVFLVGLVHGLTGAAALVLLLPAFAAGGVGQIAYLAAFGAGSTAAMVVLTCALSALARSGRLTPRLARGIPAAASLASIATGALWAATA